MNNDTSVLLNTPTKRLKNLTLCSPPRDYQQSSPTNTMLSKGYSQKLTNNVLNELNSRATKISQTFSNHTGCDDRSRRNKRYSGAHLSRFNNMESIAKHYSVHGNKLHTPSPQKSDCKQFDIMQEESASKRRRTINKNEEISMVKISQESCGVESSSNKSSPIRKISPSKGSMNLNSLLRQTTDTGSPSKERYSNEKFIKPFPPSQKLRKSSLELAGVSQNQSPPLQKKSSIPQLQKKPSIPQLQKKPSIPQLQKKSSIPQFQRKPSIPQLQKSIPQSQKSSIPALQRKPSSSQINIQTHNSSIPTKNPSLTRISPSKSLSTRNILLNTTNINHIPKSNSVTIPEPFSLYNKPTISSSQKSMNKFQRFKDKFN